MYRSYSVNDMPEPVRYYSKESVHHESPQKERCEEVCKEESKPKPSKEECAPISPAEEPCRNEPEKPCMACTACSSCPVRIQNNQQQKNNGLLSMFKSDDLIIIAVVFALLMEDCDDKLLIAALGLILFSDYFGF